MQFSIFEEATGEILMAMEVPTIEAATDNLRPGQLLVEGFFDGANHYVAAGVVTPRPTIPQPTPDGNFLRWSAPPARADRAGL